MRLSANTTISMFHCWLHRSGNVKKKRRSAEKLQLRGSAGNALSRRELVSRRRQLKLGHANKCAVLRRSCMCVVLTKVLHLRFGVQVLMLMAHAALAAVLPTCTDAPVSKGSW